MRLLQALPMLSDFGTQDVKQYKKLKQICQIFDRFSRVGPQVTRAESVSFLSRLWCVNVGKEA